LYRLNLIEVGGNNPYISTEEYKFLASDLVIFFD